jgi:hypothetical protein
MDFEHASPHRNSAIAVTRARFRKYAQGLSLNLGAARDARLAEQLAEQVTTHIDSCARALTNGLLWNKLALDRTGGTGDGEDQEASLDYGQGGAA